MRRVKPSRRVAKDRMATMRGRRRAKRGIWMWMREGARGVAVGAAATAAAPVRDEADLADVARTVDLVRGPARRSQRLDVRLPAHTLIGTIAAPLSHPTLQQHRRLSTRCLLKAPQASTSHHLHH